MSQRSEPRAATIDERALRLLSGAKRLVLTGHVHPDGDCLGAQAALSGVMTALGKEVWIVNPDPIDPCFEYLARETPFRAFEGGDLPRHDLAVLLDCSELSRCGELAAEIERQGSRTLVIDHHVQAGEPWWDAAIVDVTASATGLIVHRLARELGVELDRTSAEGVFTSLVTDTGWFKYSNTDAETLRVAAELVARGVDPARMFRAIYQHKGRHHPIDTGRILTAVEYHADGRLALSCLPYEDQDRTSAPDGDDALDVLRSVGSVEVVLFLRELPGGGVKLSARSKSDDHDVNALARRFGGGGHKKASGATIEGSLEEVRAELLAVALEGLFGNGRGGGSEG